MILALGSEGEKLLAIGLLGLDLVGTPDIFHLKNLISRLDVLGVELVELRDIFNDILQIWLELVDLGLGKVKIGQRG